MTTRDFGLIVALKTLGYKETNIDDSTPTSVFFEFEVDEKVVDDYFNSEMMVIAKKYHEMARDVKAMLWNIRNKHDRQLYR
jgi:hypothetical protein